MKKTKLLIAAIVASGLVGAGIVQADNAKLSHSDKKFIEKAYKDNEAEVEMGKLGQQRGQTAEVKQFAQKVSQEHEQLNQQLSQIAQKEGVDLKQTTRHEDREMDYLKSVSNSEFDKKFAERMVKDHEKAVKEYEKEANKGENTEVKAFAQQTLPKLQEHLQAAQTLAAATGAKISEPAGAKHKQPKQQQ